MNKTTRKLFTFLVANPPKNWVSKGNGFEVSLPTPSGSLTVMITAATFEVSRVTGVGAVVCDKTVADTRRDWEISNIEAHRMKQDRELEKKLFTAARGSGSDAYEQDVKFVTAKKKMASPNEPDHYILGR